MKNLFYVAIAAVMFAACSTNTTPVEEVTVDSVEVVADTTVAPADVTVTEVAE